MADDKLTDRELDAVLQMAAKRQDAPPQDWLANVAADAARETAWRSHRDEAAPFWRQLGHLIGGWRGLGGMAVASAAGVWIGLAPPEALGDPVNLAFGSDAAQALSGAAFDLDQILEEG